MTFPLSDFHFVSDTVSGPLQIIQRPWDLTFYTNIVSHGCHIFHERYDQQLWSINFRVINVCVCVVTKLVYFCNEYLADVSSNAISLKHCECIQYCLSNIKFLFWQKSILPKICVNLVLFPAIYQAEAALGGKVAILSFVGVTLPSPATVPPVSTTSPHRQTCFLSWATLPYHCHTPSRPLKQYSFLRFRTEREHQNILLGFQYLDIDSHLENISCRKTVPR